MANHDCILKGAIEKECELNDILITIKCRRRGAFNFKIDKDSECFEDLRKVARSAPPPPMPPPNPDPDTTDDTPNQSWDVERLKSHCDANAIQYHHRAGAAKLLELIEAAAVSAGEDEDLI